MARHQWPRNTGCSLVLVSAIAILLNAPSSSAAPSSSLYFATSLFTASPMDPYGSFLGPSTSSVFTALRSRVTCGVCKAGVTFLQILAAQNSTKEEIVKAAVATCIKLSIESENVCKGIVPAFAVSERSV
ncbi:sphingomyelin phosphodiesterase-like [Elysia marginata]|uniref:Sphingomyelin phosphodiesterase-like n=1 Tax=Elysia marginata TaxID=1093978 RepID=A0AAV4IH56_9GAST|nr:sphingomyelin phosphodiesterase-like [Elysia marginata]